MQSVELQATPRQATGKGAAHKLRRVGRIPAVLYGSGREAVVLELDRKSFSKLAEAGIAGHLVHLMVEGEGGTHRYEALVKDVQHEPIKGVVQHVDFHEVDLNELIETSIPLGVIGEDSRVHDGGIVQHIVRELKVKCLPTNIPEAIEVDVSSLSVGDAIHLGQVTLPEGVELVGGEPDEVLVSVVAAPRAEGKEAGAQAEDASTNGAADGEAESES